MKEVVFPNEKEIRFLTDDEIELLSCIKCCEHNKSCSESLKIA